VLDQGVAARTSRLMDAIPYSAARKRLNETMERVVQDREPVVIVRQKGEPVVMMSLDDYNSIMETLHLLRSPKNAERLVTVLNDAREGRNVTERSLTDA
jgi:antitoxin YefM